MAQDNLYWTFPMNYSTIFTKVVESFLFADQQFSHRCQHLVEHLSGWYSFCATLIVCF